jgi:hypothetical protein
LSGDRPTKTAAEVGGRIANSLMSQIGVNAR